MIEKIMDDKLIVVRGFLSAGEADKYYKEIDETIKWTVVNKGINGLGIKDKKGYFGRQTAVFGETHDYITTEKKPVPELLKELQLRVEEQTKQKINSIYLNKYRDKDEGIGFHRDDIPGVDDELLSIISLGDTRDMVFRRNGIDEITISLKHGDLLIKDLDVDKDGWFHSVVRADEEVGPRISVVYSNILTDSIYNWNTIIEGKSMLKKMFEMQER